ncbi:hypothetical protein O0L34_g15496 [Tuta absoluta]|nr:hypothetical protein O0L34_g15496 [Tuta absoluta]
MFKKKTLKQTHPQKYYLKMFCTFIYYLGGGNCWYEERKTSKLGSIFYNTWAVTVNTYALVVFVDQLLSSFRPLTLKEKNDVVQFDIAHSTICAKFVVLYLQKKRIRLLLKSFIEEDREYALLELERVAVKRAFRYCSAMQGTLYLTLFFYLVDGIRMHFKEGIPIRAEVVYYPSPEHSGVIVNILRFFVELHWWYIVSMMTCIDCLSVCSMVYLAYKFRCLGVYFASLRQKLIKNFKSMSVDAALKKHRDDFVVGIKLHEHALSYSRQIQHALGNLYSIQVIETMFLLVMALFKLVVNERNLTFLISSATYMTCIVVLLGGYMLAGGDITYEASLLPNSIFNSGWELTKGNKELRTLAVVALIRSQRPVIMTAFGVLNLSYSNFILVLRHSYSFFAVMY